MIKARDKEESDSESETLIDLKKFGFSTNDIEKSKIRINEYLDELDIEKTLDRKLITGILSKKEKVTKNESHKLASTHEIFEAYARQNSQTI